MLYSSIALSELIFYDITQSIKQYFNNLHDKLDSNNSENDTIYKYYGNMQCVSIDGILKCIMGIICVIYFVYQLINCLEFQDKTLLCHFMHIITIIILYSKRLYDYYNQTMESCTYCITVIISILGCCVWYLIHVYQLKLRLYMVILLLCCHICTYN